MQYRVMIFQEDQSIKKMTLMDLMKYLKAIVKSTWASITFSYDDTRIVIERVK